MSSDWECTYCGNGFAGEPMTVGEYQEKMPSGSVWTFGYFCCRACYAARNWPAVPEVQWHALNALWWGLERSGSAVGAAMRFASDSEWGANLEADGDWRSHSGTVYSCANWLAKVTR
jgi:hypothetical protein